MPYTLDQAETLCARLQHLVGCDFDTQSSPYRKIECVAVSPFDSNNKKIFLLNYLLCGNPLKALKEDYKGMLFDIVIIARSVSDAMDVTQEDIATWIRKNNFVINDILQFSE